VRSARARGLRESDKLARWRLISAGSRKRLFVGDTTFAPIGAVFVAKSFAIFAALD
jgi:hypothetical protein